MFIFYTNYKIFVHNKPKPGDIKSKVTFEELITINNSMIDMLMNHRSIRKYKNKEVDSEILDTIIECGQMAPSSNNLQAYTIIEVKDNKMKEELAQIAGGQKWVVEAPVVLLFCADLNRSNKYLKVIDLNIYGNVELYTVAVVDTALACQKSLIAAQSLGLGGVVVGGIRNDAKKVHSMFQLPDLVIPLFLLCLGYADDNPDLKPRLPKDVVRKVDYYDTEKDDELINKYDESMRKYYNERTNGKSNNTWTTKCSNALNLKPREELGEFVRTIGFLKR